MQVHSLGRDEELLGRQSARDAESYVERQALGTSTVSDGEALEDLQLMLDTFPPVNLTPDQVSHTMLLVIRGSKHHCM
jgi:hypothetical protein